MDPVTMAAALNAGAQVYGATSAAASQRSTNQANANLNAENREWQDYQANKQMAFQKEMSSTAHQREVADLQAAGLNPILSATGGSGASTPSGSMGSINPISMDPEISANTARLGSESINSSADFLVKLAQADKTNAETGIVKLRKDRIEKTGSDVGTDPVKGAIVNLLDKSGLTNKANSAAKATSKVISRIADVKSRGMRRLW